MRINHLFAMFHARNLEFFRDKAALSWNFIMPILIVAGFAFIFSDENQTQYKVAVALPTGVQLSQLKAQSAFLQLDYLQYIAIDVAPKDYLDKIKHHQVDMLFDATSNAYWYNEQSPKGYFLHQLIQHMSPDMQAKIVKGDVVRYVDWLIPGLLAMNMTFSALYGVGYVLVRYRKNGVLKRLKATPLTSLEFLLAQIASRLWLILLVTGLVYVGTDLLINYQMHGSYWLLLLVFTLGAMSLISLGLIIAARLTNEEVADGIVNMVSWPMMFLSGVWFSLEGSPEWVQQMALAFPLTHVTDAARAVMLEGAGIDVIWPQLAVLGSMTVVFLLIGSRLFRWE